MASAEVSEIENKMLESIDSDFSLVSEGEVELEMAFNQFSLGGAFPTQDPNNAEIQKHILELVKENENLKEEVTSTNVRLKEHLNIISELQSEMKTAQKELEEAHSRIEELENGNFELRQQTISLSQEKEVVKNQLKETETEISKHLQLIDTQKKEISNLKALCETKENENTDLKSQLVDHTDLKIRCESMESQLKSYEETIDQMKKLDEKQVNLRTALQESFDTFISKVEKERMNHSETEKLLRDVQEDHDRKVEFLQIRLKNETEKNEQLQREHEVKTKIAVAQIDDQAAELLERKLQLEDREEKIRRLSECLETTIEELNEFQILKTEMPPPEMYLQPVPMNQANAGVGTPMQVPSSAAMGPPTASFNTSQQMAQTAMYHQPSPMNQANAGVATPFQVPSSAVMGLPTALFNTTQQMAQVGMHPHLATTSAAPPVGPYGQLPSGFTAMYSSGHSQQPPPNPQWSAYGQQTSVTQLLLSQYAQATYVQNQHASNYSMCP